MPSSLSLIQNQKILISSLSRRGMWSIDQKGQFYFYKIIKKAKEKVWKNKSIQHNSKRSFIKIMSK